MNDNDPLASFRTEWKKELSSKITQDFPEKHDKSFSEVNKSEELPGPSYLHAEESESKNTRSIGTRQECSHSDTREESENLISTCYSKPDSCYFSFSIVGKLLNSKNAARVSTQPSSSPRAFETNRPTPEEKRKLKTDSKNNKYKKVKFTDFKNIFTEHQKIKEVSSNERLLDILIADIDEITEIPFFDISIPREVAIKIFQYLGIADLCHCAQVSKAWQSLAEDELLWCWICHRLGKEILYTTRQRTNWKQVVQHNIERQRLLVTNWKSRTGKLSQLEYVKGNILCAVNSFADVIVTGYTCCEVKLWDLTSGDSCVYQPSSTALIVNENGTYDNIVESLVTSGTISAASYTQGNIDIWSLATGTQPIQTHIPATRGQNQVPVPCLSKGGYSVAVKYGCHLDLLQWDYENSNFTLNTTLENTLQIEHAKFLETGNDCAAVIYSDRNIVRLYQPQLALSLDCDSNTSEIHNLIDAPVHAIDCKTEGKLLAVAHGSFSNLTDGCKIKLYDVHTGRLLHTLQGRALRVTCMNMEESPANELVIGSGDRKVHIFDIRIPEPVQTYARHSGGLVCVQMDDWKVMSGAWDGFVCVWDRRMNTLLWDMHNRHPVGYSHFNDKHLVVGNVPSSKYPEDEFESVTHKRYRGSVSCYNFLVDLTTQDVPEICLSTYDQPDASKYNISLAVPYDTLRF